MSKTFGLLAALHIVLLMGCGGNQKFSATLMEMNEPKFLLMDSVFWSRMESAHFICQSSKRIDRALMEEVLKIQEDNLVHLGHLMELGRLDTFPKIRLWVFYSGKEKYRRTQVRDPAHALLPYWSTYYTRKTMKSAHEIAHLLTQRCWGYVHSERFGFLLEEGFANLADEGRYHRIDFYKAASVKLRDKGRSLSAYAIGKDNVYQDRAIVCAAFVKYLINTYGIRRFETLWKCIEKEDAFESTYHMSFLELDREFNTFLATVDRHSP